MDFWNWQKWRVVAKLDPDKDIPDQYLKKILASGVATVMVGGTQYITAENTLNLINRIHQSGFQGTLIQEISEISAINGAVTGYALPVVLNAGDKQWVIGAHHQAIKNFGPAINWAQTMPLGYIVCNPDSAVAKYTGTTALSIEDAIAYATLASKLFRMPAIYVEYSGIFGHPELVKAVTTAGTPAKIIYGGGISKVEQALEMLAVADAIVIGNALYDNPDLLSEIKKAYPF